MGGADGAGGPLHATIAPGLIAWIEARQRLEPFQRRFVRGAFRPGVRLAALSGPRGLGKSALSGWLLAAALDPSGPLFVAGGESVLLAGSLDQARAVFRFLRGRCDGGAFRFLDSGQRVAATHVPTHTRVRVASSDPRKALGIVGARLLVGDEPGAWQERGGAEMYDALTTSAGKSAQTLILIGTRAPGAADGWWRRLLDAGSGGAEYVQVHQGAEGTWDRWRTIARANPLAAVNPHLRAALLDERAKARRDPDAKRRFLTMRLNLPQEASDEVLVTVADWRTVEARPLPSRSGRPIVGIDLGATRSWSAAWCLWPSGRVEVYVAAPGLPGVEAMEKRDAIPRGLYAALVDAGVLVLDQGRRVSRPSVLLARLADAGIVPRVMVGDRFNGPMLADLVGGRWPVVFRATRWSEATEDVAAFRRAALDGPLSIAEEARPMVRLALANATMRSDDQGSVRIVKRRGERSRDDVAQAGVLACGLASRAPKPRALRYAIA